MKIIKNTYLICIATLKAKENKTDEVKLELEKIKKIIEQEGSKQ